MTPISTFEALRLPAAMAKSLVRMQFITPTPVQAACIPVAMQGKDVLGTAQTGTGKTGAFGIPLLAWLSANRGKQALILAPTRELAAQIHQVLEQLSSGMDILGVLVVGGESFGRQRDALHRGVDYIVATPGRLNDHLQERTANLSDVGILVFDEVDRMLDMGFIPQIRAIVRHVPTVRQTLFFSATLPPDVMALAAGFLKDPVRIAIGATTESIAQVKEETLHTAQDCKNELILEELDRRPGKILIFTRTKSRCDRLAKFLNKEGHKTVWLHGGRSQGQRKDALSKFKKGTHGIMVATDLAGRGIDVVDIEAVINYDLPGTREDYIHRIGRTGRNGKEGNAVSFVVKTDEDWELITTGVKPQRRPHTAVRRSHSAPRSSARPEQTSWGKSRSTKYSSGQGSKAKTSKSSRG